jgi:hypothetical protein
LKHKFKVDGSLDRYKAHWLLRGFTYFPGVGYDETINPVVTPVTIRTVLTLVVSLGWPVDQLNVKNAFLHDMLTEMVYHSQPIDFVDPTHP